MDWIFYASRTVFPCKEKILLSTKRNRMEKYFYAPRKGILRLFMLVEHVFLTTAKGTEWKGTITLLVQELE
jgi:hypothetical protein